MRHLHFCFRWLTAVAVVAMLILLAWQCIDIYLDGYTPGSADVQEGRINSVFRMEDVQNRLHELSLPLFACSIIIIITKIMDLHYSPIDDMRNKLPAENRLRMIKAQLTRLPNEAVAHEHKRLFISRVLGMILAICLLMLISYFVLDKNFVSWDLEIEMRNMLYGVIPWIIISFVSAIAATLICSASIEQEIRILRSQQIVKPAALSKENSSFMVTVIRITLCVAALLFIMLGVMNGGMHDVLVKAINICTECIGLG